MVCLGFAFQIRVYLPADVQGSVALRAEEDAFWGRWVSSMLLTVLSTAGYSASVDEFFYQDYWSGPNSLSDQVLLVFGDPLQKVDIPFIPTTLVQDWSLL